MDSNPPKAEAAGSNPAGCANDFNNISPCRDSDHRLVSAQCPRNLFVSCSLPTGTEQQNPNVVHSADSNFRDAAPEGELHQGAPQPIEVEDGSLSHPINSQRPSVKKSIPHANAIRNTISSVDSLPVRSNREKDDNYRSVLFGLNERWRVAACKDDIQWLLQYRDNTRWHARACCRTREGLARCIREYAGPVDATVLATIAALPDCFGGDDV